MAAQVIALRRDIHADAPGQNGPVGGDLDAQVRMAGQRMEIAMAAGQRGLARVWMDCMYGLIREREAARVGCDIEQGAGR
jgi:hypothetical protein